MAIVIRRLAGGAAFTIYACGTDDSSPLLNFLERLEQNSPDEVAKIWALIDRTAEHGPPRNEEKCRSLSGTDLFEFKTTGGIRVLWFYDKGNMIITTHGFVKKQQKTPRREIARAERMMADYKQARDSDRLRMEDDDNG